MSYDVVSTMTISLHVNILLICEVKTIKLENRRLDNSSHLLHSMDSVYGKSMRALTLKKNRELISCQLS